MVKILIILSVVLSLQVGWSCSQRLSMAGECRLPLLQMEGTVQGQIYRSDNEDLENTLSFNFTIDVCAKKILMVSDTMQVFLNYETAMTYVINPKCQREYLPINYDMDITFQTSQDGNREPDDTVQAEGRLCGIKSIKIPRLAFKQVHLSKFRILSEKISEKSTQRMNNFPQECIKNTPTAILVDG